MRSSKKELGQFFLATPNLFLKRKKQFRMYLDNLDIQQGEFKYEQ